MRKPIAAPTRKARPAHAQTDRRANRDHLWHRECQQRFAAEQDEYAHDAAADAQSRGRHQRGINDANGVEIFTQRRHDERLR
jgi:hypothetical protein